MTATSFILLSDFDVARISRLPTVLAYNISFVLKNCYFQDKHHSRCTIKNKKSCKSLHRLCLVSGQPFAGSSPRANSEPPIDWRRVGIFHGLRRPMK